MGLAAGGRLAIGLVGAESEAANSRRPVRGPTVAPVLTQQPQGGAANLAAAAFQGGPSPRLYACGQETTRLPRLRLSRSLPYTPRFTARTTAAHATSTPSGISG